MLWGNVLVFLVCRWGSWVRELKWLAQELQELSFKPKFVSKTWVSFTLSNPWDVEGTKLIRWFLEDELLISNDIL